MIVKENIKFERGRDPKSQVGIGLGPSQHIHKFESTLNLFGWEYSADYPYSGDDQDVIAWTLTDEEFGPYKDKDVFLWKGGDKSGRIGWRFFPLGEKFFDDPSSILEDIISTVYEETRDEIQNLSESLENAEETYKKLQAGIKKLGLSII